MKKRRDGFTLVEFAIVFTVIGLIIGGLLVTRSLIRQAELRAVIAEADRYTKAIGEFKTKYNALPGDMYNAEDFWGSDAGCPNTPSSSTPHTATCNGNGDGQIDPYPNNTFVYEEYRAWQQLADAQLIDGTYSGTVGSASTCDTVPGVNTPVSKLPGNTSYLNYFNAPNGDANVYPMTGHVFSIAAGYPTPPVGCPYYPILTGAEALSIDTKLDDGVPGAGKIRTWKPAVTQCADNADPTVAKYITSNDQLRCTLFIITDL
ncbi:MAG: prepilin-type N-terminal cleavage/methylation domain-containing protein [Alphaproteobacteria bacterium]|nr:prepilin-type N-terminal cleavage/methylation domain-containing protein [Alphaproteobacteria bacterium]